MKIELHLFQDACIKIRLIFKTLFRLDLLCVCSGCRFLEGEREV